jgi:hypothetical protein
LFEVSGSISAYRNNRYLLFIYIRCKLFFNRDRGEADLVKFVFKSLRILKSKK